MKKILGLTLLGFLTAGAAWADHPCPVPMGGPGMPGAAAPTKEMIKNRFGVNDEKAAEMEKLIAEQREKHRAMREQHMAEMQKHDDEMRERMTSILGEEQMKRMDEARAQRRAMRGGMGEGAGRMRGQGVPPRGIDAMPIPGPWAPMPAPMNPAAAPQ